MANVKVTVIDSVITNEFKQKFADRVEACSKVKVKREDVLEVVNKLFSYVEKFNSLGAYDVRVLNREVQDILIVDEFARFITPRTIRDTISDLNSTDILVRPKWNDIDDIVLSYDDFMNYQIKFRGFFKKDIKESMSNLATIKADETISNISSRFAVQIGDQLRCRHIDQPYIPIIVDPRYAFLKREEYFNSTSEELLTDYLTPVIF